MKKFLSIMMVAFMAISFAACGSEEKKSAEDQVCDEFVELCGQVEKAVKAGDKAEMKKKFTELQEVSKKMLTLDKDKVSESQEKRVEDAAHSMGKTFEEYGVTPADFQ